MLRPRYPAKEKGRRRKGIMEMEDNHRSGQGTSTGTAALVSRDMVVVTVNRDTGMRVRAEEEAREDLMDQAIRVQKGNIRPGKKPRTTRQRWCHNVLSATRLTMKSTALGLAASISINARKVTLREIVGAHQLRQLSRYHDDARMPECTASMRETLRLDHLRRSQVSFISRT